MVRKHGSAPYSITSIPNLCETIMDASIINQGISYCGSISAYSVSRELIVNLCRGTVVL